MQIVEGAVAALTVLSVLLFGCYLVAMFRSPSGQRARTPVYSRLGEELPPEENPGYKETEDEQH